ncbi:MAG: thiamine biosynthesis protein ThiS [Candidatus Aminicenantes bacterium]|nr:thiamine biosynthesis protein ThiS [Candidatus Aminicenantes bacterium]
MKLIFDGREIEIPERRIRVKELLKKLKADELYFLVIDKKRGRLLTSDEVIKEDDQVEIKSTISSG